METEWQTPPDLFAILDKLAGGFKVDAAATELNHLCPNWYGPGSPMNEDALDVPVWETPAFCNPPYGRGIGEWLVKMKEQAEYGNAVIALLPAKTETVWWCDGVVPHADILFLRGRVPFLLPGREKKSQPNHGSAIVSFEDTSTGKTWWWDWKRAIEIAKQTNNL